MYNIFNFLKKPSAKQIAQRELEEAHRNLLKHEAASHFHKKISEYCQDTIDRLDAYIEKPY